MKRRYIVIVILVIVAFAGYLISHNEVSIEDKNNEIVVYCAEPMLWDFSYIAAPELQSTSASHFDFLALLASDDIFLFDDKHPFKKYDNYIGFKADYYREMFGWGDLPPEDILERAGIVR